MMPFTTVRDPEGYSIEVGPSTGLLVGHRAAKQPEDLPGESRDGSN